MTVPWTQTYAYLAYVVAVMLAVVNWLGEALADRLYARSADGQLDDRWLEFAHWLAQYLRYFTFTGVLLALVAMLLAAFSAGEPAAVIQSHRGYLLRLSAIVVAALCLSYVGHGDLSRYYIDLAAAVACVWALWVAVAGWRALAGGVAVAGPALWWLGLVLLLLIVVRLIALIFFVSPDSPHQF
ncbi:hypothetical protein [Pelagibius sp. 7325]|uniref:hypothetical protein n=1 Tax=Pelagibius sp. 7325 TaxID=3131994 RepID=UPI0030EB8AB7